MDISQIDILTLLPQQPPFIMVDRMVVCDEMITKTEFLVHSENIFSKNGVLVEAGIVENMAQTCAARMGFRNSILEEGEVKIGVIGSIKNLNIYMLPKDGTKLTTQIEVVDEVFNMTLLNARVLVDNELIADCEMKISTQ